MTWFAALVMTTMALVAQSSPAVTIRSDFRGGNIKVSGIDGDIARVAPDLRGGKPWFYWCLEATAKRAGTVTFSFPKLVGGFPNGAIGNQGPAVCKDGSSVWQWLGTDNVAGSSFTYEFMRVGEVVRFAVCLPYVQSDLAAFLKQKKSNRQLHVGVLTKSLGKRSVELLQIGKPGKNKRAVLVTGRHHACEAVASYVLEGFLDEAMSASDAGRAFREQYVLYAVPFVDKDGVEHGDQGKNRRPHDHNRDYREDSLYPEVQAIKRLADEKQIVLALDFHCPTLVMKDHQVMYFAGARRLPSRNVENTTEFAQNIRRALPKTAPTGPLIWLRTAKRPTPMNSHWFGQRDGTVMAATIEIPFAPPGKKTDPESLREYGKVMLRAWVQTEFSADRAISKPGSVGKPKVERQPQPESKPKSQSKPKAKPVGKAGVDVAKASGKIPWLPPTSSIEQSARAIVVTKTPKATADAAAFRREYRVDCEAFAIHNDGTHAQQTSKGLNAALQDAKAHKANRIVFAAGTYLISADDPIVIDHRDTIIDLNGATLRIEDNAKPAYRMIDIVRGASNVRLTNGVLIGDRERHDYSSNKGLHEWGHGVVFHGGRNIEVDHLHISQVTGDGANSRFTGARTREELLAQIAMSLYAKHFESGAFTKNGTKVADGVKSRTIDPVDMTRCGDAFEFGYSTGYLGYPFLRGRQYLALFYDENMRFLQSQQCLQFRKVALPARAKFAHFVFEQASVSDVPFHAGAGKGSFVARVTNFHGPVDVHFHDNVLHKNRRLGFGFCGGRQWLIEDNVITENGGTAPGYGIDFEDGWEFMQDVVLRNNTFKGNLRGDLVICAGSELRIEGNDFTGNVAVHARPHNYEFINNRFRGGSVTYRTRTGVARFRGNTYEDGKLTIAYDTKAVADGLPRLPGQAVATPPLQFEAETLRNVSRVTGTYFVFRDSTFRDVQFVAGNETRLVDWQRCDVRNTSVQYEAKGPPVTVNLDSGSAVVEQRGAGLTRIEPSKQSASPNKPAAATHIDPTESDVPYGSHKKQVVDFYRADRESPTPVVVYIHGGAWWAGSKAKPIVAPFLAAGISVVSVEYRFLHEAKKDGIEPMVRGPMMDAARALQFVRSKAKQWTLSPERIGAMGGSAGACSSLWLAFHDDLADKRSKDPISRQSTRLFCAAVNGAQTTLDPNLMQQWTPNSSYGGHAFGLVPDAKNGLSRFEVFLARREQLLPWIRVYSPMEHVTRDDPPVALFYRAPPAMGQNQKDPTHTANFGVGLLQKCQAVGARCELVYPGAPDVRFKTAVDYLIATLKAPQ